MLSEGKSTRTANRKLSTLKAYFRFLNQRGLASHDPTEKVPAPKIAGRLPVHLKKEELDRLFDLIPFEDGFPRPSKPPVAGTIIRHRDAQSRSDQTEDCGYRFCATAKYW
jgi:site-specific recombinase XerD